MEETLKSDQFVEFRLFPPQQLSRNHLQTKLLNQLPQSQSDYVK